MRSVRVVPVALLIACGGYDGGTTPTEPGTLVATSIDLSATTVTLESWGATATLIAIVKDQNGAAMSGQTVTWASSDPTVAAVSDGTVTAVADGTAVISATSGSATATVTITVVLGPPFFLAANGVTVMCPAASVGDTGVVNGVTYTKRGRPGIDALVAALDFAALETSCTSGVTDMSGMFRGERSFNADLSGWDVSSVFSMRFMFYQAPTFNADLSGWDVSNVTDMWGMFYDATSFDADISDWDVSSVTAMYSAFYQAMTFNRDLSGWCVANIPTAPDRFDLHATSWTLPRPVWGACPR